MPNSVQRRASRVLDALVFSGLWPAGVAACLVVACSRAMGPGASSPSGTAASMALAAAGTFVVYNVDRLRDIKPDRLSAPDRSRFVEAHRGVLLTATAASALLCLPLAILHPPRVWWICAVVLALGLAHRRLKGAAHFKVVYVTGAWLAIVVGIPALAFAEDVARPGELAALLAVVGLPIAGNLVASELRGHSRNDELVRQLKIARLLAAAGVAVALVTGGRIVGLVAIPAVELMALIGFRRDERYGLVVLDGALLVGALASVVMLSRG